MQAVIAWLERKPVKAIDIRPDLGDLFTRRVEHRQSGLIGLIGAGLIEANDGTHRPNCDPACDSAVDLRSL